MYQDVCGMLAVDKWMFAVAHECESESIESILKCQVVHKGTNVTYERF